MKTIVKIILALLATFLIYQWRILNPELLYYATMFTFGSVIGTGIRYLVDCLYEEH